MRRLITGGAGFIGSNYVRHVLDCSDDEIVILDALTYAGNLSTLGDVIENPRVTFVHGNICDRGAVASAMTGCDTVVHFAAESHVDRSILGPDAFIETNCAGTNVVCDVARQLEVSRLVHISTDEVYGSVEQGSSVETDVLAPRSPYSASKAASDLIALSYHATHELPVVVTRSSNNFGPFQYPEKLIPLFTTNLLDGKRVPLYGDGLNVRDWIAVSDNCAALEVAVQHGVDGEIYNIGAGHDMTNIELVRQLLELVGADEAAIEPVADRLGHDRRYSVDVAKIRALGWAGAGDLADALASTVDWYRENRQWWEPLKGNG